MNIIENIKNSIEIDKLDLSKLEEATKVGLPNPKVELWKYTALTFPILNYKYVPAIQVTDKIELFKYVERFAKKEYSPIYILNGQILNIFPEIKKQPHNLEDNYFAKDFFYYINQATNTNNYALEFNQNSEYNKLSIISGSLAQDDDYLSTTNIRFAIEKNTEIELDFYFSNFAKKSVLQNNFFFFSIAENAKLKINIIEDDHNHLNLLNNFHFELKNDAKLDLGVYALDGAFVRNNFQVDIDGENCDALLNGLYIGSNKNVVDNHLLVNHNKPNSHSNQFFRGILQDKSRGVFNGKIYVKKDAQKTNAYQLNKNILTSEDAQIFTKPELEIYADDVKCSHGATSGFLQENEMFYLMSRGINPEMSKSLLLKAFANEVIERSGNQDFVEWLEKRIEYFI